MKYDKKTVTITNDILTDWYKRFEDKDMTLHDDVNYIIPAFCVWSFAHQDNPPWVAAGMEMKLHKPIYTGEQITFEGSVICERKGFCKRLLTAKVAGELRHKLILKCMHYNG